MTGTDILSFFKEPNSALGIFYPLHYIVASFPTPAAAEEVRQALSRTGMAADEILAAAPADVLRFYERFRAETGVEGKLMRGVSRMLGDDATFVDGDIERARKGAGFLFVHSPLEEHKKRITEIAEPYQPIAMRWYTNGGIESLV